MIVIVEGIDRVGKTTLCKMLEQAGFLYFKDEWILKNEVKLSQVKYYSVGKLDTTVSMLKQFHANGVNIVVDRLHITEWVYSKYSRGYDPDLIHMNTIDRALDALDATLVYVMPESITKSSDEHGSDLSPHEAEFYRIAASSAIKRKIMAKYSNLEYAFNEILDDRYEYDLYLASPFFSPEQVEREEFIKDELRRQGLKVFSPKENCFLPATASNTAQQSVFKQNCDAIKACKAVFAITDGRDIGTIWETGYAYGVRTPVVYFAETLGEKGFNLMLAQSGKKVILSRDDINAEEIMASISLSSANFKGLIE